MCLSNINLNLEKRGGEFVGTGYKKLIAEVVKNGSLVTEKAKLHRWSRNWTTSNAKTEADVSGQSYRQGFHIFLSYQDAKNYIHNNGPVVRVEFKDVICFGENEIDYNGVGGNLTHGPCVVANKMRIVEIYEEDE